jgi:hypothetical protein
MNTGDTYFFPWVRKGLSKNIGEEEVFGIVRDNDKLARLRPVISIHTKYRAYTGKSDREGKERIDDKDVRLFGPGDVTGVRPSAVSLCHPNAGSADFPCNYFPYVEFWEPDFPWRYTPAKATADGRLRPWLALLAFRADQITIYKPDNQLPYLVFGGDEKAYKEVFYDIRELSRAAHAQGQGKDVETATLSRIIGLRGWVEGKEHREMVPLESFTDYVACVVPTFESGRLRGLGSDLESLADIVAQAPAWEAEYADQKAKTRGMEFPIYYSWTFRSGDQSFEELVKSLTLGQSGKAGVKVDVAHMGEGFDYQTVPHDDSNMSIIMPAATRAPEKTDDAAFPASSGNTESILYDHLSELVCSNPVFLENAMQIGQPTGGMPTEGDDPVVVPPVYGARHVMATSLKAEDDKGNTWLSRLNLDVHYRAIAGLGRKVILENQEVLMDRAWKQVEAVQALNRQLYRRLLSMGANTSLQGKVLGQYGKDNKYLASLMFYLGSMKDAESKNAAGKDVSISSVLSGLNVPEAFATPSFHRMTDQVAKFVDGLDTKSVMENILEHQTFRFPEQECRHSYSIAALRTYADDSFNAFFGRIMGTYIRPYYEPHAVLAYVDGIVPQPFPGVPVDKHYMYETPQSSFDHLIRLPETFKSASFEHWNGAPVPGGIVNWYVSFFQYAYSHNLAPAGDLYSVLKYFFDGEYDCHPCYGFAHPADGSAIHAPNLIGYPANIYVELFGSEKPITAFRMLGNYLYIVNETVMQHLALSMGSALSSQIAPVMPVYNVPGSGDRVSALMPEISEYHFVGGGTGGGGHHYYWTSHAADYVRAGLPENLPPTSYSSNANPSLPLSKEECSDLYHRAFTYLSRPSRIDIKLGALGHYIQYFESEDNYKAFLFARRDSSDLSFIRMWNEYNDCVCELERLFPSAASDMSESLGIVDSYYDSFSDAADKEETQPPTMKNELAYEEAMDVVKDYYSEFYADTEMGEKLRNEYINELLRTKYPIIAYPIFPEPAYYYLKKVDDDLILPGAGELPDDSVTVFKSNSAFVEAYLAGMNTEMGRELLWREYPTDQRGSYFRKFWDSESSVSSIRQQTFFDIEPMHDWKGALGSNMLQGKENLLIFAIKGRLMRLYPTTRIYLARAVSPKKGKLAFDPSATVENKGIYQPVMETFLDDLLVLGFNVSFEEAVGNPDKKDYGYFLTFQEDVQGLDFIGEKPDEDFDEKMNPAEFANKLKNDPSVMGKHVSLFLK